MGFSGPLKMLSGRASRAARCIFPVFCNSLANKIVVAAAVAVARITVISFKDGKTGRINKMIRLCRFLDGSGRLSRLQSTGSRGGRAA